MRSSRLSALGLLAVPCLLSGCAGFYDEILLNADGSGSYRLTVFVKKGAAGEDLGALQATVRERAGKVAAAAGFTLVSAEVKRDGPLLVVEVKADFPSLAVFANPALSVSGDAGQWSFVVPREASFKDGRFTAHVLRGSSPPRDHAIRAALKGHEARFTVHFPGEVVGGNGAPMERSANWTYSLDHLCDLPVEMVAVSKPGFSAWSLALGAALVAGLGILAVRVLRKRPAA